jgi:predicted ArsR family transcriptional regulator
MNAKSSPAGIDALAPLAEPTRRALYEYVVSRGTPVGRDEAARAAGTSRALAAFHLDRLAEGGLLVVEFRRLSGRSGPGAGRPAKLYRRAAAEVSVSLPPRRYDLAGLLMARALARRGSRAARAALLREARSFGRTLAVGAGAPPARTRRGRQAVAIDVLATCGYEPFTDPSGVVRMRNCPFHTLAGEHRELVCGMNLALLRGVLAGLSATGLEAVLDPAPGRCCVAFRAAGKGA